MGTTLWCIAVVCAAPFLVGVPIQRLLNRGRPLDESAWLQTPFIGLAVIVLISQNLVYLDWRPGKSATLIWAFVLLGWLVLAVGRLLGRRGGGAPVGVFAAALAVYLFHGMGLLYVGAHVYAGHGWWDQWNYVSIAQFFLTFPFHTDADHIGRQVVAASGLFLKHDRIGQSLLHAFFTVSTFRDAKTLFEPTILLAPALTVLAVHALARRLGLARGRALLTAVAAGLLPGVATLHLDSFLSQALATPFLLLVPVALDDLHRRPGWAALLRAALLLAAVASIYTEYLPILLGCLALALPLLLFFGVASRRQFGWYAGLAATTVALNLGFARPMLVTVMRVTAAGASANTYPWAMTIEGWARVWLGDGAANPPPAYVSLVRLYALGVPALAYFGLWRRWRGSWQAARAAGSRPEAGRALVLLSLTAGLAALPLLVAVKDSDHPYQFFKLQLAVSPLLVLGLTLAALATGVRSRLAALLLPGAPLLLGAAGTGCMVLNTVGDAPRPGSFIHIMHGADLRRLQDRLAAAPPGDLVLALHHCYLDSWMSYLGRKHRVRLYEPEFVDATQVGPLQKQEVFSMTDLPAGTEILTRNQDAFAAVRPGDIRPVYSSPGLRVWKAGSKEWALPIVFTVPRGAGSLGGVPCSQLGPEPTTIEVLAGAPGRLTLRGDFLLGSASKPGASPPRRVCVATSGGVRAEFTTAGGPEAVTIPLDAGRTAVSLTVPPAADGGAPPVAVLGLTLEYAPGE